MGEPLAPALMGTYESVRYTKMKKTLYETDILVVMFHRVTPYMKRVILTLPVIVNFPASNFGEARLQVYSEPIGKQGLYRWWIKFRFPEQTPLVILALMLRPSMMESATQMIRQGKAGCFVVCPPEIRRGEIKQKSRKWKRMNRTQRRK